MRKIQALFILLSFLIFFSDSVYSVEQTNVNILTWWGYLDGDTQTLNELKETCNATVSYDDFYSNDQFLSRFHTSGVNYDIIIFSDTVLNVVKDEINLPESDLYKQANNYFPAIKKHYFDSNLPRNVVYYINSLTGFLYNPEVADINSTMSVYNIFNAAKNNIVVMIDDPIEANFLMGLLLKDDPRFQDTKIYLTQNNFKNLFQNTKVIITNSPEKITTLPSFAFAVEWSGDALSIMENSRVKLDFLIHPELSYISTDMLGELNDKPATKCVARYLTSKAYAARLQNSSYYFSPYGNYDQISDPYLKKLYLSYLNQLPALAWISPVSDTDYQKISYNWKLIKVDGQLNEY